MCVVWQNLPRNNLNVNRKMMLVAVCLQPECCPTRELSEQWVWPWKETTAMHSGTCYQLSALGVEEPDWSGQAYH